MKVFISVPMFRRTDNDVSIEIELIKTIFMMYVSDTNPEETVEFVDNLDNDVDPSRCVDLVNERLLYLGEAIRKMAFCDAIIFAPKWNKAKGCFIEHEIAKTYGLTFYNLQTDYNTKCCITKHKYINGYRYRLQSESNWIRDL